MSLILTQSIFILDDVSLNGYYKNSIERLDTSEKSETHEETENREVLNIKKEKNEMKT